MGNEYIVVNTKKSSSNVWETISQNYVPSKGEVCIIVPNYDIFEYKKIDDNNRLINEKGETASVGVRIGDGEHAFIDLPLLGDVNNIKPDWTETNPSSPNYIWHKPMVNGDMFDFSEIKVLRIENSVLKNALNSTPVTFHAEDYCLIKDLDADEDFTHPDDLLIKDDRNWGHYEFQLDSYGINKAPRYFYRNNIVDQIEQRRDKETEISYHSRISSLLDSLFLESLKNNEDLVSLFLVKPYNFEENFIFTNGIIYKDNNGNYYEHFNGIMTELGKKYYVHNAVLADIWDISSKITEKFYINGEIDRKTLKDLIVNNLNKNIHDITTEDEKVVFQNCIEKLTDLIYNKIYTDTDGKNQLNINLIRSYINSEATHYYEINDELILDYNHSKLYLKKSRLQYYMNIVDGGKSVSQNLTNDGILEFDNVFGLTEEDLEDVNISFDIKNTSKSRVEVIDGDTKTNKFVFKDGFELSEEWLNNTKIFINSPRKEKEAVLAKEIDAGFKDAYDENLVISLNIPEDYEFIKKGITRVMKVDNIDKYSDSSVLSFDKVILNDYETRIDIKVGDSKIDLSKYLENIILEYIDLKNNNSDKPHNLENLVIACVDEKNATMNLRFKLLYNSEEDIKIIINESDLAELKSTYIKDNETYHLYKSIYYAYIYENIELDYSWINTSPNDSYILLEENSYLNQDDYVYFIQEGFSELSINNKYAPVKNVPFAYDFIIDENTNEKYLQFNNNLYPGMQIEFIYSALQNYNAYQNYELKLNEKNKLIVTLKNLPNFSDKIEVIITVGGVRNAKLGLNIFYQTRRIKDYLLSNRRVNWDINNPKSLNYVQNRPLYINNDGYVTLLKANPGEVYTNDCKDYYSFFEKFIKDIHNADNGRLTDLENRIARLEEWRRHEIDPYAKKLKNYQYEKTSNKIRETISIGGAMPEGDVESLDYWAKNYDKVGSMKALNDLADYYLKLYEELTELAGSQIHIGEQDPDEVKKYGCKVWLCTGSYNGNGLFYYRTISTKELQLKEAEGLAISEEEKAAAKLWIPVSAIWSARLDEDIEEEQPEEEEEEPTPEIPQGIPLIEVPVGATVYIGDIKFINVQHGFPEDPENPAQGRVSQKYYKGYNSNIVDGTWLYWNQQRKENNEDYTQYVNGVMPFAGNKEDFYNDIYLYGNAYYFSEEVILNKLNKMYNSILSQGLKSSLVIPQQYNANAHNEFDYKVFIPTAKDIGGQGIAYTGYVPLEYFKSADSKNRRKYHTKYFTLYLSTCIDTDGEQKKLSAGEYALRPMIILHSYNTKVLKQNDGSYKVITNTQGG